MIVVVMLVPLWLKDITGISRCLNLNFWVGVSKTLKCGGGGEEGCQKGFAEF